MTRSAEKQQAIELHTIEEQVQAEQELRACYESWYKACVESGRLEKLESRVFREVQRLQYELSQGKINNVSERFASAVENVEASARHKRKSTYLNMVATIRELSDLNIKWYKAMPRSKSEQAWMLRQTRHLMLEIAAGNIDNLSERFHLMAEMIPANPPTDASSHEDDQEV